MVRGLSIGFGERGCSAALIHRVSPQGLSTGFIHRVSPQGFSTGFLHRVYPQGLSDVLCPGHPRPLGGNRCLY